MRPHRPEKKKEQQVGDEYASIDGFVNLPAAYVLSQPVTHLLATEALSLQQQHCQHFRKELLWHGRV